MKTPLKAFGMENMKSDDNEVSCELLRFASHACGEKFQPHNSAQINLSIGMQPCPCMFGETPKIRHEPNDLDALCMVILTAQLSNGSGCIDAARRHIALGALTVGHFPALEEEGVIVSKIARVNKDISILLSHDNTTAA